MKLPPNILEVVQVMRSTYRRPLRAENTDDRDMWLRLKIEDSVPRAEVFADMGRIRQVGISFGGSMCVNCVHNRVALLFYTSLSILHVWIRPVVCWMESCMSFAI